MADRIRPRPLVYALEGVSGAGKTTISRGLARVLEGVRIEEAYWRLSPQPPLRFGSDSDLLRIERTLFQEELRRTEDARRWRSKGLSVVLDTDFLGPLTYVWGLERLGLCGSGVLPPILRLYQQAFDRGRLAVPDASIYLAVPEDVARARAARALRTHPPRLSDRHRVVGRLERQAYRERLAPVLGERWLAVPARGPPERVVARIVRAIPYDLRPVPTTSKLGQRLLVALAGGSATTATTPREERGNRSGNR